MIGLAGCDDNDVIDPGDGGGGVVTGGAADLDLVNATPATGNTNISGSAVTVQSEPFTGSGTGGFVSGMEYTRVQVDAMTDGHLRRVLVYFETASGSVVAVSYLWGASDLNENIVYCPAIGCSGLTVYTSLKEIAFLNMQLDNNDPFGGAPTKFATVSLGMVQYP